MNIKRFLCVVLVVLAALGLQGCTVENINIVKDTSWQASDDSVITYDANNSFKYYKSKDDLSDNYYLGTYECYTGEPAVKYITKNLKDFGITKQELDYLFKMGPEYKKENFACIVLSNNEFIVGGQNTLNAPVMTPYYGFYFEDKNSLNLANMNSGNYFYFSKVFKKVS